MISRKEKDELPLSLMKDQFQVGKKVKTLYPHVSCNTFTNILVEGLLERMNLLREITNIIDPSAIRRFQSNSIRGSVVDTRGMDYEELIALGNRIGNVKKGLTKEQINV
jgi:hypothetical protein